MKLKFAILLFTLISAVGCNGQEVAKIAVEQQNQEAFSFPKPPAALITVEQKAAFIATHYWDNYDFSDTTLINNEDITEQAFVDFVNILPHFLPQLLDKGATVMMEKASVDSAMYAHFAKLSEKYLYDPNSPYRNEDIYIPVLRSIIANPKLSNIHKIRPRYQLELALKNRVGDKATDFTYNTEQGNKASLYRAVGAPLLLFFFRPGCPGCEDAKAYMKEKGIDKRVTTIWVNPDANTHLDTLYDLKASPTLYLLDKDKRVLLKDASMEQIEGYLHGERR